MRDERLFKCEKEVMARECNAPAVEGVMIRQRIQVGKAIGG